MLEVEMFCTFRQALQVICQHQNVFSVTFLHHHSTQNSKLFMFSCTRLEAGCESEWTSSFKPLRNNENNVRLIA